MSRIGEITSSGMCVDGGSDTAKSSASATS